MKSPLISIIIPTYNRIGMLINAIDSILKQNYENYEIIIVDDCSKDNVEKEIEKYNNDKIKYYRNEINSGAGISRKNGYCKANGKYIVFMDDDDYYLDRAFFSKCIQIYQKMNNISFVAGNSLIHYEDKDIYEFNPININGLVNGMEYLLGFQTRFDKPNSTFPTMFRKDILDKMEKIEILNDSSIYMNALLYGDSFILEDVVGVYRIHKSNLTFNLDVDFLIANLVEKRKIYDKIKNKLEQNKAKEWLYGQINLTLKYYIINTNIGEKEIKKLIVWCEDNGEGIKLDYLSKKSKKENTL